MFDVGFWELALISIVALLFIGPQRLPGVIYQVGLWVGKARRMVSNARADFQRELREHNVADLGELKHHLEDAGGQFQDATRLVSQAETGLAPPSSIGAKPAKSQSRVRKKTTRGKKKKVATGKKVARKTTKVSKATTTSKATAKKSASGKKVAGRKK